MPEWRITRYRGKFALTFDELQPDGTSKRRRFGLETDDRAEAERRAPSAFAAVTRPGGTTVAELWDGYTRDRDGRAVLETMKHTWKALAPRFGKTEGELVSIADCRAHTEARRLAGKSDGTIHTELGHLRMVLKWAEAHKLIGRAPAIERPAKPEPKEACLTRGEVDAMIAAANAPHIVLAIRLLIGTGARVTAALELTWDRVDFERGMIHLRNPFDKTRRKGRSSVPMNGKLRAALTAAKAGAQTPFVIEWAGRPVKSMKRGLRAAGTAIGRPDVSAHMLRHSSAVWLAEDGHSMSEISQFLGHGDSRITARVYARYSPDHLRSLAASLEI